MASRAANIESRHGELSEKHAELKALHLQQQHDLDARHGAIQEKHQEFLASLNDLNVKQAKMGENAKLHQELAGQHESLKDRHDELTNKHDQLFSRHDELRERFSARHRELEEKHAQIQQVHDSHDLRLNQLNDGLAKSMVDFQANHDELNRLFGDHADSVLKMKEKSEHSEVELRKAIEDSHLRGQRELHLMVERLNATHTKQEKELESYRERVEEQLKALGSSNTDEIVADFAKLRDGHEQKHTSSQLKMEELDRLVKEHVGQGERHREHTLDRLKSFDEKLSGKIETHEELKGRFDKHHDEVWAKFTIMKEEADEKLRAEMVKSKDLNHSLREEFLESLQSQNKGWDERFETIQQGHLDSSRRMLDWEQRMKSCESAVEFEIKEAKTINKSFDERLKEHMSRHDSKLQEFVEKIKVFDASFTDFTERMSSCEFKLNSVYNTIQKSGKFVFPGVHVGVRKLGPSGTRSGSLGAGGTLGADSGGVNARVGSLPPPLPSMGNNGTNPFDASTGPDHGPSTPLPVVFHQMGGAPIPFRGNTMPNMNYNSQSSNSYSAQPAYSPRTRFGNAYQSMEARSQYPTIWDPLGTTFLNNPSGGGMVNQGEIPGLVSPNLLGVRMSAPACLNIMRPLEGASGINDAPITVTDEVVQTGVMKRSQYSNPGANFNKTSISGANNDVDAFTNPLNPTNHGTMMSSRPPSGMSATGSRKRDTRGTTQPQGIIGGPVNEQLAQAMANWVNNSDQFVERVEEIVLALGIANQPEAHPLSRTSAGPVQVEVSSHLEDKIFRHFEERIQKQISLAKAELKFEEACTMGAIQSGPVSVMNQNTNAGTTPLSLKPPSPNVYPGPNTLLFPSGIETHINSIDTVSVFGRSPVTGPQPVPDMTLNGTSSYPPSMLLQPALSPNIIVTDAPMPRSPADDALQSTSVLANKNLHTLLTTLIDSKFLALEQTQKDNMKALRADLKQETNAIRHVSEFEHKLDSRLNIMDSRLDNRFQAARAETEAMIQLANQEHKVAARVSEGLLRQSISDNSRSSKVSINSTTGNVSSDMERRIQQRILEIGERLEGMAARLERKQDDWSMVSGMDKLIDAANKMQSQALIQSMSQSMSQPSVSVAPSKASVGASGVPAPAITLGSSAAVTESAPPAAIQTPSVDQTTTAAPVQRVTQTQVHIQTLLAENGTLTFSPDVNQALKSHVSTQLKEHVGDLETHLKVSLKEALRIQIQEALGGNVKEHVQKHLEQHLRKEDVLE